MHNSNWDNLRFVLAVIDAGSVSAAARHLGVNHATVLRRIATFEEQYGGAVFDKTVNGYRLLPEMARLIEAVREVESGVLSVQRLMQGAQAHLSGVVRVASTDTICHYLLPGVLAALHRESPELEVELLSNNSHLDFARMQADVFVRPAMELPEHTSGEIATRLVFRAYGTADCPERWLALKGPLTKSAPAHWLDRQENARTVASGSDSFLVLCQMAKQGLGLAILPSFVGENEPYLICSEGAMPDISVPIWVGSHEDLRHTPRIRAVRKRIVSHLGAMPDLHSAAK